MISQVFAAVVGRQVSKEQTDVVDLVGLRQPLASLSVRAS